MAEGVERMHHFAKNKQGLKTLELQSPNLSHFPGPKSIHFISLFFFSFSLLCAAVSQQQSELAFNHFPDAHFNHN